MSSCDRFRPDLVALERDELTPAEAAAVRDHVTGCSVCATELRKLRRTVELVARATAIEPVPAAAARMRRSLDAEVRRMLDAELRQSLDATLARTAQDEPARAPRGVLRSAWEHAQWRYERSAAVRRFTLASIGLHAAAAAVLVVLLTRSSSPVERPGAVRWEPGETVTLPDDPLTESASLPAFDAMSAAGVESLAAPGVRFPNRTTADRLAMSVTVEGRRESFRVAFGDAAERAAGCLDRGLAWLATQRGADGAFGGADPVEATAAAVLAYASDGRSTVDDPALGSSVEWLARNAEGVADVDDRALAIRARSAQFAVDFGRLAGDARSRRARDLAGSAAALARAQNPDGGFGRRPGERSDVASTVAAAAALADVRSTGVTDSGTSLASAVRWIEWRRSPDGRLTGASRLDAVALTAALAEMSPDIGARPMSETATAALAARVPALATSPREAAIGVSALAVLRHPLRESLQGVIDVQRTDGRWSAPRASGAAADDVADTAWGAFALTRTFRR